MSELLERTFEKGGTYLVSPQLSICPHIGHAFFTRQGGVSKGIFESLNFRYTGGDNENDIAKNYKIAAEAIGGSTELVFLPERSG